MNTTTAIFLKIIIVCYIFIIAAIAFTRLCFFACIIYFRICSLWTIEQLNFICNNSTLWIFLVSNCCKISCPTVKFLLPTVALVRRNSSKISIACLNGELYDHFVAHSCYHRESHTGLNVWMSWCDKFFQYIKWTEKRDATRASSACIIQYIVTLGKLLACWKIPHRRCWVVRFWSPCIVWHFW